MDDKKIIKSVLIVAAVIGLLFFIFYPRVSETRFSDREEQKISNPFDNMNLEAKAIYVFDLAEGREIFERNSLVQLPLASLTKIMTAVVAQEINRQNNISQVIDSALAQSSNVAASILASTNEDFIDLMNKKAEELNLRQTYFLNETGLDISNYVSGGNGSAQDIAKLIGYAVKNNPELFEATTNGEFNSNIDAPKTTQLIASKTGFTDMAGGNLAVVVDVGFEHPVAIVALGSSKEGRFSDIQKLIEATFKYLTANN